MNLFSQFAYTPEQVRELDRRAIEDHGIPGYELMCRAGQIAFDLGLARFTQSRHWLVLCGSGNNAGDGYVIARLALAAGCEVTVVAITDPLHLKADARKAFEAFRAAGGETQAYDAESCPEGDLVIDAMLGSGLERDLEGSYLEAVNGVNQAGKPVLAVDVPTGINSLDGKVMGAAVRADVTVSFVGLKQGLFLGEGLNHVGELMFDGLGIPQQLAADLEPGLSVYHPDMLYELLPPRAADSHKGMFGHVLLVGGNAGMGGAVRMSAEAALRAGAGLVSVATREANVGAVLNGRPELMVRSAESPNDFAALLQQASVLAIGPGLGQDDWAERCFERLISTSKTKVLDADALNLLALNPMRRNDWILTPHPGEAARLLETSSQAIQEDRLNAVKEIQSRYGGVVVLKGHGSLVAGEQVMPVVVKAGNPGMATAGMGDVLTGVIAALLAQCNGLHAPAVAGVYVHAIAGDLAASAGERGTLASDLFPHIRSVLNR
ncbi:MAG: NAD(P)H-hydrate dehydratase [Gammaproteobacteria bacterium]|nr:NAD(P)H-hydrate dehydratase [Gammaproteobacteria bacterium]